MAISVVKGSLFETNSGVDPLDRMWGFLIVFPGAVVLSCVVGFVVFGVGWTRGLRTGTAFVVGLISGLIGIVPLIPTSSLSNAVVVVASVSTILVAGAVFVVRLIMVTSNE